MERRKMLRFLGAEIELTPKRRLGMNGAIAKAQGAARRAFGGAVMPGQFDNPANPGNPRAAPPPRRSGPTPKAQIDVLVSGVGTGGTLTGCARTCCGPARPNRSRSIAVEPEASPVLSGGRPAPHMIQGIGAGFVPSILDCEQIDEVIKIANETALATSRELARTEGVLGGISSGAALAAAIEIGEREENKGKTIVVIVPSFSERYITTALFEGI